MSDRYYRTRHHHHHHHHTPKRTRYVKITPMSTRIGVFVIGVFLLGAGPLGIFFGISLIITAFRVE